MRDEAVIGQRCGGGRVGLLAVSYGRIWDP